MTVRRVCKQCGEEKAMQVRNANSHRLYCDDCRRARAVQATLRARRRKHQKKGEFTKFSEVRKVRIDYDRNGAFVGLEVI